MEPDPIEQLLILARTKSFASMRDRHGGLKDLFVTREAAETLTAMGVGCKLAGEHKREVYRDYEFVRHTHEVTPDGIEVLKRKFTNYNQFYKLLGFNTANPPTLKRRSEAEGMQVKG